MDKTNPWEDQLNQTNQASDFHERQTRNERILSDPRRKYREEIPKPYATTEMHRIVCANESLANESMPEAKTQYGTPHVLGNFMLSDRLEVPAGWIKSPGKGISVETIKADYPELYAKLIEKNVSTF